MAIIINGRGRVGVRTSSGGGGGSSYGTLTTAWIAATGESDATILGALNTLESDLNGYGILSKMKALYPFVGGTSTKHSYNFINPGQYQITFNGGWTHSSTGATPNGTNAYGNTNYNLSTQSTTSNISVGFYSRVDSTVAGADFGAINTSENGTMLYVKHTNNNTYWSVNDYAEAGASNIVSDTRGFFVMNKVSVSEKRIYKNGTQIHTAVPINNTAPNVTLVIGARNRDNVIGQYSNRENAFTYFGDTLTNTEVSNFYTAVQAFQTTLGRQV